MSVDVELNLDHANFTASSADLSTSFPITVEFADGETEQTVGVAVADDAVADEGCEGVVLSLLEASGGASVGLDQHAVIAVEDLDVTPYELSRTVGSPINPSAISVVNGDQSYEFTVRYSMAAARRVWSQTRSVCVCDTVVARVCGAPCGMHCRLT